MDFSIFSWANTVAATFCVTLRIPNIAVLLHWKKIAYPKAVVPNLGPPGVLGLQLPESFTTTSAGQDFWELKSKNI